MEGTVLEEFSPAECNHGWLAVGRLRHPVADGLRVLVADRFRARMVDIGSVCIRAVGRPAGQDGTG